MGSTALMSRCSSPAGVTARSSTPGSASCRASSCPATCSSSTPPRRCPAALPARLGEQALELHLSTPTGDGRWAVELRTDDLLPFKRPPIGTRLELPGGAHAEIVAAYLGSDRLGLARLSLGEPLEQYLRRHGRPIRYGYLGRRLSHRRLPDGVRARARQRRDAERRPPVHRRARRPSSSPAECWSRR